MGVQCAGSKDAAGEAAAAVVVVHFAAAAADSAVESIPPVKQVEVEFVSVFPMSPGPKYAEEEAVAAAASEPAGGLVHFDRW